MRMSGFVAACALLLGNTAAWGDAASDRLVQGCRDFVKIYKTGDTKRGFTAFTASTDEALRAGYCGGVIAEYRRSYGYVCTGTGVYEQAAQIAKEGQNWSVKDLLRRSCGG